MTTKECSFASVLLILFVGGILLLHACGTLSVGIELPPQPVTETTLPVPGETQATATRNALPTVTSTPTSTPTLTPIPATTTTTTPRDTARPTVQPTHPPDPTPLPPTPAPSPTGTSIPVEPPSPPDWTLGWLSGIPCQLPCWEGVMPGVATQDDAMALLEEHPRIEHLELIPGHVPPIHPWIEWTWQDYPNEDGGDIHLDQDYVVGRVCPGYPFIFPLEDVLVAYGEPSHVIAQRWWSGPTGPYHKLLLIYMDQGFAASVYTASFFDEPLLQSGVHVESPCFFAATEKGFLEAYPIYTAGSFVEWQGYQDFEFYCQAAPDSLCETRP
jgi:hypothetical protein